MKFKSKNKETMLWLETIKTMVSFKNGVADVDDKVGKEMIKFGYIQDSNTTPSQKGAETKTAQKVEPIKPIKPIITNQTDSDINEQI